MSVDTQQEQEQVPRTDELPPVDTLRDIEARVAEFTELKAVAPAATAAGSLEHLLDVHVTITAELGRVTMEIGDLLKLGVGSVLELDRPIAEPVDLMVQGVRLARGEVVVVDDHFAICIKEIAEPKKRT